MPFGHASALALDDAVTLYDMHHNDCTQVAVVAAAASFVKLLRCVRVDRTSAKGNPKEHEACPPPSQPALSDQTAGHSSHCNNRLRNRGTNPANSERRSSNSSKYHINRTFSIKL